MIHVQNLSFRYDDRFALKNVSFEIEEGDFVAVLGPNGAGKTTLVKLIVGLLPMQRGTLEILGVPAGKQNIENLIGYVPQRYAIDRLFPGTVREILDAHKTNNQQICHELGIPSILGKKFIELSGGQQQRVLIALALQNNPKILVLDEPTVGVDVRTEKEFLALLKHMNEKHSITMILVTHDVGMVPVVANKVLCISHDTCCMGPASKTHELLKQIYPSHEEHHHHGVHHA